MSIRIWRELLGADARIPLTNGAILGRDNPKIKGPSRSHVLIKHVGRKLEMIVIHKSGFLLDDGSKIHRVRKGEKASLETGDRVCFDVNKKFWFDVTHVLELNKNEKAKPKLFGKSSDKNKTDEVEQSHRNTRATGRATKTPKTRSASIDKEDEDVQHATTGELRGKGKKAMSNERIRLMQMLTIQRFQLNDQKLKVISHGPNV